MNAFFINVPLGTTTPSEEKVFIKQKLFLIFNDCKVKELNDLNFLLDKLLEDPRYLLEEHPSKRTDVTAIYTIAGIKDIIYDSLNEWIPSSKLKRCSKCNKIHTLRGLTEVRNGFVCNDCLRQKYTKCDFCGKYELNHSMYHVNDKQICLECLPREGYGFCDRCGDLYLLDEMNFCEYCDAYFCDNCDCHCDDREIREIHDYGFKPRPIFHGKGKRFFGFELEIDGLSSKTRFAKDFVNSFDPNEAYLKRDGSLSDSGVEIVSHPYSFDMIKKFQFENITKIARKHEGLSHDTTTCGFHIHVNANSFENYELSSTRILFIFERFWNELVELSRRKDFGYCRKGDKPSLSPEFVKNVKIISQRKGRYQAVNFCNEKTIEFRLWKGTLNVETIIATIELTDLICAIADSISLIKLQTLTWDEVKTMAKDLGYKTLLKYCKRRNV